MEVTLYVNVCVEEGDETIELPTDEDGNLSLSSIEAQFSGAIGLSYRPEENEELVSVACSNGRLFPPDEGWGSYVFTCEFQRDGKRKQDDMEENESKTNKRNRSDGDNDSNTIDLIVLGLPYSTTDEELREQFEEYGELIMAEVKKDNQGKSKGFGFIKFADYESQKKVVNKRLRVGGRHIEIKFPKHFNNKIFIGRMKDEMTNDDLSEYFGKYGEITDVYVPKPFKGIGYVTFENPLAVQTILAESHSLKGSTIHVDVAKPQGGGDDRGGRGGGRGGRGGGNWNQGGGNMNEGGGMPNMDMATLAQIGLAALSQAGGNIGNLLNQGGGGNWNQGGGGGGGGGGKNWNQGEGGGNNWNKEGGDDSGKSSGSSGSGEKSGGRGRSW